MELATVSVMAVLTAHNLFVNIQWLVHFVTTCYRYVMQQFVSENCGRKLCNNLMKWRLVLTFNELKRYFLLLDNVHFQNSAQLVEVMTQAGVKFEMQVRYIWSVIGVLSLSLQTLRFVLFTDLHR